MVAVEAKAGKNKLSQHQERMKAEIEAAGGLWITAYSGLDVLEALNIPTLIQSSRSQTGIKAPKIQKT